VLGAVTASFASSASVEAQSSAARYGCPHKYTQAVSGY
jgi:hypothetical protein